MEPKDTEKVIYGYAASDKPIYDYEDGLTEEDNSKESE